MFESAQIGHKLTKSAYHREEPKLRAALLEAQYELLAKAEFPVIVVIGGVDGAGKGETVNQLNAWMDPRHISTEAFGPMSQHERQRPDMWRFWKVLPPKGKIAILFGSWYTDPIVARALGEQKNSVFEERLERIRHFERMLVAEGALVLKLWFHLSKKAQKKRFRKLEADPLKAWHVTPEDWANHKLYDAYLPVCEEALRATSTGEAPWQVIEASDTRFRELTAGKLLLAALRRRLEGPPLEQSPPTPPPTPPIDKRTILNQLDYTQKLTRKAYEQRLEAAQARLNKLTRWRKMRDRALVVVMEGLDAAGKGSSIRRMTQALDARHYRVIPIAAPSEEERARPYLWRFWRHVPKHGHVTIFDRSWYGRVLVERVEKLCSEFEWMRAYDEINQFERELADNGTVVVKFWLAISPEEQLRRFEERKEIAWKQYKLTPDDWRNRARWAQYEHAVCDMVDRTSVGHAPWHVIAAEDKLFARVAVLETICAAVEKALQ